MGRYGKTGKFAFVIPLKDSLLCSLTLESNFVFLARKLSDQMAFFSKKIWTIEFLE